MGTLSVDLNLENSGNNASQVYRHPLSFILSPSFYSKSVIVLYHCLFVFHVSCLNWSYVLSSYNLVKLYLISQFSKVSKIQGLSSVSSLVFKTILVVPSGAWILICSRTLIFHFSKASSFLSVKFSQCL